MNYLIRELKQDENKVLDTFLYEAIFIPEGVSAPPKDIINQPDLQVYYFSKCYLAFSNGTDNGFWKIWSMYQGMC